MTHLFIQTYQMSSFVLHNNKVCPLPSLQPSLLAIALLCFEAQEQHDPEHNDKISDAMTALQQQLNVRSEYFTVLYQSALVFNTNQFRACCFQKS